MPDQYPYIISNNKIEPILRRIRTAAKPEKLSMELIATWGFTASNDRAAPRVLKALGFLTENGAPTSYYDRLRDPTQWKQVLGERIKATYADLYSMDPNIHAASEPEVKGAISRITGKDEESVKRYYATFKALCAQADFNHEASTDSPAESPVAAPSPAPAAITAPMPPAPPPREFSMQQSTSRKSEYHYNIQIHLPVTTEISVYNAIFKSLRENLGV